MYVKNIKNIKINGYIFKIHIQKRDIQEVWRVYLQINLERNFVRLLIDKSTLTHKFSLICFQYRLSTSITLPNLQSIPFLVSTIKCPKSKPHTWTQKGEWMKVIFAVSPFLHQQRRSRLLSKFHGQLFSTHSMWYFELTLNGRILFPTSTILRPGPIFLADLSVLLSDFWFCWWSGSNHPNKLKNILLAYLTMTYIYIYIYILKSLKL